MQTSQNGYNVITSSASPLLVPFGWVTGRVLTGAVRDIFEYLATQFDERVEKIDQKSSWGYANRKIRLGLSYSNHASGTALDFNAPKHPLGRSGTFTPAQVREIEAILNELQGAVRWGGHYKVRKDEMHFEIVKTPAQLVGILAQLESNGVTGQWTVTETRRLQSWLNRRRRPIRAWPLLAIDGVVGKKTIMSLQFLLGVEADGDFGPASARALERYLGLPAVKIPGWYPGLIRALQRRTLKENS